MNNPAVPIGLDPSSLNPPSSPLSSLPSSDGFGPDADADADQAFISEDDKLCTDEDDEAPDSPPRKRKKRCLSSIAVPASVKAAVMKASGGKCWLCNLYGVHTAHVIAKSDKILFEEYRRSGLLHLDGLHSLQNLMYLCAGCHSSFDARVPVWAFLPTNLSDFIARETEFQRDRASAAACGIALQRPDPCEGKINNLLYSRYMIRDGYIPTHPFLNEPTKRWLGNPVAAILRSGSVLMGVQRLDPTTQGGLPDLVARNFHHLMYLYGKTAPPVLSPTVLAPTAGMLDPANYNAPDSGDQLPSPPRGKQASKHTQKRHRTAPTGGSGNSSRKRKINREQRDWVLGPKLTSNMMMEWRLASIKNARERGGGECSGEGVHGSS
ncbi:hypothetical protein Q9L58_009099 [Maublancomyces gigas]|uniref:HNH nuclease domain-containing protein n=1 Tax=Discina gigas TaxID=1032678 RepID=A0ABR3G871_9PEZI